MAIGPVGEAIALRGFAHATDRDQGGDATVDGGAAGATLPSQLGERQWPLTFGQSCDDTIVD
jgi:hypothetical protein